MTKKKRKLTEKDHSFNNEKHNSRWEKNVENIFKIATFIISILALVIAHGTNARTDAIENHDRYMERLNYYYKQESGDTIYKLDGESTGIIAPKIRINLKSGSISKLTFISWQDGEIHNIESLNNIDIEKTDIDYDELRNKHIIQAEYNSTSSAYAIKFGDNAIIAYYILIEGMGGDRYLDLVVEEIDLANKTVKVLFYNQLDALSADLRNGYLSEVIQDYMELYELLEEKGIL